MVAKSQNRISGPILDRIDILLEVPRVPIARPASLSSGEPSSVIRARVEAARARQAERFAPMGKPNMLVNGDMGPDEVQRFCQLDEAGCQLLRNAAAQMNLSAPAYHRVLKLARTIADLAGEESIRPLDLAKALQYRPRSGMQARSSADLAYLSNRSAQA